MNKKLTISLVACTLLATNLLSNDTLSPLVISSSSIKTDEKQSTFSTEIYTKKEIEESKAKDVYDFLSAQTSVNVSPNYGNTFSQKIDLRGYGIGDGHQNIVITVNGRRLNNIDLATQVLSAIPLESVEKIEIIKGSGSVAYGDGANAGAINIITNGKNDNYIKAYTGKDGQRQGTFSFGHYQDNLIINALVDYTATDGNREKSATQKSDNYNKNKNINLIYYPQDNLELRLGRTYSNMNTKYGGKLTLAQYNDNPSQTSSFTKSYLRSYVTTAGLTYDFSRRYSLDLNVNDEDKLSRFTYSSGYVSTYNYEHKSLNSKLNIKGDSYKAVIGVDAFNADRVSSSNTTSKDNKGIFFSSNYFINKDLKVSFGARKENVDYTYAPTTGTRLNKDLDLSAYDLGFNYSLGKNSSLFINYNKSFQAPDIDRFFNHGGTFNGFIEPAKVDNYSIGYNNLTKSNKLKISLFRANLKNEIYYYSLGGTSRNTNIDKSHKHGLELFDKYLIDENFSASVNYAYIIAKIDEELENGGSFNGKGKDLPGVSKHNVTVNLAYKSEKSVVNLSHTYRSSTYAANDFENNFSQKQAAYKSTDLSASYKPGKKLEFFAKIQNLFDKKNGLWIKDDNIYPTNFERTYYAGLKLKF